MNARHLDFSLPVAIRVDDQHKTCMYMDEVVLDVFGSYVIREARGE